MPMQKDTSLISLQVIGLISVWHVTKICLHLPAKLWQRLDCSIQEMSAKVDTEEEFDLEFTVQEMISLYGVNSVEDLDRID